MTAGSGDPGRFKLVPGNRIDRANSHHRRPVDGELSRKLEFSVIARRLDVAIPLQRQRAEKHGEVARGEGDPRRK
jgi:hypothetical protein